MLKEVYGLIACGGKSSRMGKDKFLLEYHGIPQWQYIVKLLEPLCEKVFVSIVETQSSVFPGENKIIDDDEYAGIGPMSGLLSAFNKYPHNAFLFIGCDYPFIKADDLQLLIDARDENEVAVAFFNEANIYEPLIALYEPSSFELLKQHHKNNLFSLRMFLEKVNAKKIPPSSKFSILSVDTIEQYRDAKRFREA